MKMMKRFMQVMIFAVMVMMFTMTGNAKVNADNLNVEPMSIKTKNGDTIYYNMQGTNHKVSNIEPPAKPYKIKAEWFTTIPNDKYQGRIPYSVHYANGETKVYTGWAGLLIETFSVTNKYRKSNPLLRNLNTSSDSNFFAFDYGPILKYAVENDEDIRMPYSERYMTVHGIEPYFTGTVTFHFGDSTISDYNLEASLESIEREKQQKRAERGEVDFRVNGFGYVILGHKVRNDNSEYVCLTKIPNSQIKKKKLKIPNSVKYKGKTYKVYSVNPKIFKKCKKVETLFLGSNFYKFTVSGMGENESLKYLKKLKTVISKSDKCAYGIAFCLKRNKREFHKGARYTVKVPAKYYNKYKKEMGKYSYITLKKL